MLDRDRRQKWLEEGGTTLGQRLNARVKKILAEHQVPPLAPEKKERIQVLLAEAGR